VLPQPREWGRRLVPICCLSSSRRTVLYTDIRDFNLPIVYLTYLPLAYLNKLLGIPIQALPYLALDIGAERTLPQVHYRRKRLRGLAMNRIHLGQRDTICALLFLPLLLTAHHRIQCQGLSRVHCA
jgi:hypothetical protein